MKVGDVIELKNRPDAAKGKILRFYANHGTVLVELIEEGKIIYCDYSEVENYETR